MPHVETLRLAEVVDRLHDGDLFAREWKSFDPVAAGERIATRHDGSAVVASASGCIVFPNPGAAVGHEWFYLAEHSARLDADAAMRR